MGGRRRHRRQRHENQTVSRFSPASRSNAFMAAMARSSVTSSHARRGTPNHAAGIQSQFHVGIFRNYPSLLTKIDQRPSTSTARRDVHRPRKSLTASDPIPIEPNWSADEFRENAITCLLRDTYAAIRTHLITRGAPTFGLRGPWFDRLPVDGGQIG